MKNEIINKTKGKFHGHQQWYIFSELSLRGKMINGQKTGYVEYHYYCYEVGTIYYIR